VQRQGGKKGFIAEQEGKEAADAPAVKVPIQKRKEYYIFSRGKRSLPSAWEGDRKARACENKGLRPVPARESRENLGEKKKKTKSVLTMEEKENFARDRRRKSPLFRKEKRGLRGTERAKKRSCERGSPSLPWGKKMILQAA